MLGYTVLEPRESVTSKAFCREFRRGSKGGPTFKLHDFEFEPRLDYRLDYRCHWCQNGIDMRAAGSRIEGSGFSLQ